MKKRMIAGLMAVLMTMSLAACGSSAGSSDASGTGSAATGDNSAAQAASGDKVTLSLCWWGVGLLSGGQRQALTLLMATLKRPKLLLLDEHTAALDPKTAAKVMELTDRIVREGQLTTLMITHNMRDAIQYGNRLIMLHDGHVILDIAGEEKEKLTVPDLLEQFTKASGDEFANDRAILS